MPTTSITPSTPTRMPPRSLEPKQPLRTTSRAICRTASSGDGSAVAGQESVRTDDGPAARTASAAGYEPAPEPIGHLAAEHPYGAGSASPGPDGSGPADYVVKGDAGAMVYYEEGHPDYEQTTAEVWFESAAHAEAAGFRAPRRTRL